MSTRCKWLDHCSLTNRIQSKSKLGLDADNVSRYFQVCVNILEGKKLTFTNLSQAASYVMVGLDKVKYRTSVRRNMRVPFYRENFVFELFTSLSELKRKCVWLAVMEPGACGPRLLGEASLDLAHVWGQANHRITHKWVQLALPSEANKDTVGYLKVDVCISVHSDVLPETQERIEDCNLLLPYGSEQQPACYQITVYRAYSVPCSAHTRPDLLGKPPSTSLRITFCDLVGETSVQHRTNNPLYVERVSIVEMFPNICQLIQLEVCSASAGSKVLASTELKLSEISHGGENGFLPTFGPSLLHMYGPWRDATEKGPFHRGALLVAMKTIVPYYKQCIRTVNVEPINVSVLDTEWIIEDFVLFCPVFEVSMLDKRVAGTTCGVAVTLGEIPFSGSMEQDADEFVQRMSEIKQKKHHYTGGMRLHWNNPVTGHLEFATYPVLQLAARLPDFRFRMYRNNVIHGIVNDLENELSEISDRLLRNDFNHPNDLLELLHCTNDDTAAKLQKFLDIVQYSSSCEDILKYSTELDQKLVQLQKEKIEKIYCRIISRKSRPRPPLYSHKVRFSEGSDIKKTVKIMLAECRTIVQELKDLIFKTPDGWPDISIWLLSNGSRIAHTKMAPSDVIHSVISEQNGRRCGKIQTVYLKPIKCPKHRPTDCFCIAAKVELLIWMGAFRQRAVCQHCLPEGYRGTESGLGISCEPMSLECCINIYRAKLDCGSDAINLSPFVRINFMNNVKDTQVCQNTVTPVWCEVLRVSSSVGISPHRLNTSPPEILVEVYHCDATQTGKTDLLGRVTVLPIFMTDQDTELPPLEWFDVHKGTEYVGRIQLSAHIMQITESILRKTWIHPPQGIPQRPSDQVAQVVLNAEGRESLPVNLLPANLTYKIDVYFWGLREVSIRNKPRVTLELEDVTVKSAIITDCKPNCNFPNARVSEVKAKFHGNLSNGSSALSVKLYDTTSFGRTLFAGLNIVKRPQKFLVSWIPNKEREESLFMKPIVSNVFMQVNRKTFVKQNFAYPVFENPVKIERLKVKEMSKVRSYWDIFWRKADEEEIMLLPMYSKGKINAVKETEDDWWTRYYASINDRSSDKEPTGNRIMIYDSELEAQPEFSRFKDWCSTIKIYNGDKTGIPEYDEKLQCGYLKACIAIYQWPPPADTVAVTSSGVDLGRGYFDSAPSNDQARYLVRVYAVKCTGLVSKGFTTSSKCYVMVQCSNKRLGDRESSVMRSTDPVFGKMFEYQCTFPEDYLVKISVMDCGLNLPDELIGSTSIDLENRVYTKYRATVGLAAEYNINGPNKWRDSERPSTVLGQLCERNHLPAPEFPNPSTVVVNGVEYKDLDSVNKYTSPLACKENLCLSILHKWHTMPVCGHKLVPEHVEARALYDPEKPGVEQGKIHIWVDLFPLDSRRSIPAPVAIRPRPDEHYELRVTVWEVQGVRMTCKTSIYVRAWIGPSDEAQDTDIYTSSNGEGHFNWRMIFQFQYKYTERKLVLHDKGPFTEVTELFPPILVVQVLDIDATSLQDYLGTLALDLSAMPLGARHTASALRARRVNLFSARNTRGWWPLRTIDRETGNYHPAGMIDLELSLLPKDKAVLMPVGLGREPPVPLPDPIRQPHATYRVDSIKSDCSIHQYRQGIWMLVGIGLLVAVGFMCWDVPVIILSVVPTRDK